MTKIPKYLLSLAGEYRVCSELNLHGLFATITYGTRKGVDVYVINDRKDKALRIEVKTSQRNRFVTGISQKYKTKGATHPDFWVLCQFLADSKNSFKERFFVLSHDEIRGAQSKRNRSYSKKYFAKHGKELDLRTGVDNIRIEDVEPYENQWSKIAQALGGPEPE